MCGIFGMAGTLSPSLLEAMGKTLQHRGPDESGEFHTPRVGLGIRRLSIVDPQGGQQPVQNETGTLHAVFNGEIYNHLALRRELIAHGHRFQSHTDTEVIVHAYEEYGAEGCCQRLDGMFAFALWDEPRQELILARDRVGEKPLFYSSLGEELLFASEIKAILQDPRFRRTLNTTALDNYLSRLYVPGEDTLFEGIQRLKPGHLLRFHQGRCTLAPYWTLPFHPKTKADEATLVAQLHQLLSDSVKQRLAPQGPTGLFLSGGLDSSAILGLAQQQGAALHTYAMGFEAAGQEVPDERAFAAELAQHFHVPHREIVVTGPQVRDALPKILWHFDEPFSGAVPQYFLSQQAAQETKVVLSGLGGDELLGNYGRRFRLQRALGLWGGWWDRLPRSWRPEYHIGAIYAEWFGAFNSESRQNLFTRSAWSQLDHTRTTAALLKGYLRDSDATDLGDQVFLMDFKTQLVSEYLTYSDVLSMAWALECRAPFLSTALVEFAARLPASFRNRPGEEKILLRKAMAGVLPETVMQRKKAGFSLPYTAWLRSDLKDMLLDYLSPARIARGGYFRPESVQRLLDAFYREQRSEKTYALWALLCFEIWREVVFHHQESPAHQGVEVPA